MTKEEAINGLKENLCFLCAYGSQNMDRCGIRECDNRDYIKALEQQPSDCVSKAEVLKQIKEWRDCELVKMTNSYHYLEKRIQSIQPVTSTQKWIPVSERLPEEDGEYLLYGKIDEDEENYIFIGEYDSCGEQFGIWQEQFDRTTLGCLGSEFFEYSSVLAWQPLPQPYKEKRGDKNEICN